MQKGTLGLANLTVVALLALPAAYTARADVFVEVTFDYGMTPETVNIEEGDAVYWYEGDDWGPYQIVVPGVGTCVTPGILVFDTAGSYPYYNDWGDFGTVNVSVGVPNIPPVVTITNPVNHAVFNAPATFAIEVDTYDPDAADVLDVEFWIDDTMVDDDYYAPYGTTITDLPAGTYTLTAIAWDFDYDTATNTITITVINPGQITLTSPARVGSNFRFDAIGLFSGRRTVLQSSTNVGSAASWVSLSTNTVTGTTASFTNAATAVRRYYRVLQLP
jgi:hypothetical protein